MGNDSDILYSKNRMKEDGIPYCFCCIWAKPGTSHVAKM